MTDAATVDPLILVEAQYDLGVVVGYTLQCRELADVTLSDAPSLRWARTWVPMCNGRYDFLCALLAHLTGLSERWCLDLALWVRKNRVPT